MYRVMIIDDEKALRNLMIKTIPWNEKGLIVAGEAASGIEAINTIDEVRPDIAFVDIEMPFMNGIEFSKLAIKRYPKLKILILTAFDNFNYARECIGVGVSAYLLKPIVRQDINSALDDVVKKIDEERAQQSKPEDTTPFRQVKSDAVEEYLQRNYVDASINLTYVAEKFGFNPSYLSRKFKEKSGVSFIDYLTSLRIERACELARAGEMMYITAEKVGIPDPNYFGKCFKKYKGVAYSEYMKQV